MVRVYLKTLRVEAADLMHELSKSGNPAADRDLIFVADLGSSSSSGLHRLWALRECGLQVTVADVSRFPSPLGRFAGKLGRVFQKPEWLYDTKKVRAALEDLCRTQKPAWIWCEWPRYFTPNFLRSLRRLSEGVRLISFQDDNPFGERRSDAWQWKRYLECVPEFDLHLVKRESDVDALRGYGAGECRMWMHGVYEPCFHPALERQEIKYPVSFVGTCMDGRAQFVERLLEEGIPLYIFGTHWEERSNLPARFPGNFHPAVRAEAYAETIRASQMCLGFVSHSNRDEWTMRTFEVPGCAGMLVAERTPTHQRLFEEGREAEFFGDVAECADKIRRYLSNPERCREIGEAARAKCLRERWGLDARMRDLLKECGSFGNAKLPTAEPIV